MIFPLEIFLYIYYAFLALWSLFSLVAVYHMMKFGFKNSITFAATFGYIAVSVIILAVSFDYINQIDWQQPLSIMQSINFNLPFLK